MGDQTTFMAAETEALRETYAAINRNDIPAAVKAFDPEIEWIEPTDYPTGGTYRGREAVEAHLTQARASWAEGSCEPEEFIVAGDKVVVLAYVRARLSHEAEWREGNIGDVYTFRDGKVVQFRSFRDAAEALAWVGVERSD